MEDTGGEGEGGGGGGGGGEGGGGGGGELGEPVRLLPPLLPHGAPGWEVAVVGWTLYHSVTSTITTEKMEDDLSFHKPTNMQTNQPTNLATVSLVFWVIAFIITLYKICWNSLT